MNAIFHPIFIYNNGTSNVTNEGILSVMLAFIVLGVLLCIGSLIYSMLKAKISNYWGFNWEDIRTIWSNNICYLFGLVLIIIPTLAILFALISYYIYQILI
jgi:hypothetical protein